MADLAARMALVQRAVGDPALQSHIVELCSRDIVFWFNHFAYTFNPRKDPYDFPFNLHPFQINMVKHIHRCIEIGEPVLIKKSRDMGATWIILLVFQWFWMFEKGSDFYVTSRTLYDVDKLGDKSTMFEKIRYNIRWQPAWLCPQLTKTTNSFCKIVHPFNGNTISGGAPTTDLGRSKRFKAACLDEFARLPYGRTSYESISQSTDCIIMPYTPYGKANAAYEMSKSPDLEELPLDTEFEEVLEVRL